MPLDNAKRFLEDWKKGEEYAAQIIKCSGAQSTSAEDKKKVVQAAQAAGQDFTYDELSEALLAVQELSDDELEAVAGGTDGDGAYCCGNYCTTGCKSDTNIAWCNYSDWCRAVITTYNEIHVQ